MSVPRFRCNPWDDLKVQWDDSKRLFFLKAFPSKITYAIKETAHVLYAPASKSLIFPPPSSSAGVPSS